MTSSDTDSLPETDPPSETDLAPKAETAPEAGITPEAGMAVAKPGNSPASTPISHRLMSDDGRMSIAFHWRNDRYDHVIAMVNGSKNESLFRSVNGSADEDWPASPAIQQLSTETIEGKPTVLGVGCCGTSHFSVSVQAATDPNGTQSIRFDWAVRLSKELDAAAIAAIDGFWLGTTYKTATRRGEKSKRTSRFMCSDNVTLENVREGETALHRIRPQSIAGERTVQWTYWITVI